MTAVPAFEHDPYILALPAPGSPVVLPQWIRRGNTYANSQYHDLDWSLAPLIDNPSASLTAINWRNCPPSYLDQLKLITWIMINGQLRPTYLQTRGRRARGRASAQEMKDTCADWMGLARWLDERGVSSLIECTGDDWRGYVRKRALDGLARKATERLCSRLTDLWAFDQLSACPIGVTQPPWENEGIDDFLPEDNIDKGGENTTEPLSPLVLGPLLIWAIRMVDDLADDILVAWAEVRQLNARAAENRSTPESRVALEGYLLPLLETGAALPSIAHRGERMLARTYIAGRTGASFQQVDYFKHKHQLTVLAAQRPGPCPLQVPVSGQINGRPWREYMDFTEAAELMRHLGTAAIIICLYLTGMRPQEVQGLRSGCCPDPAPDLEGSSGRHLIRISPEGDTGIGDEGPEPNLIHGHHYKNVIDDDGNHVSAGELRSVPWVAIAPVVHAIRVLERIVPPEELLLSAAHHDFTSQRGHPGALKNNGLNQRIEDFVAWANREAETQGLTDQVIPEDPHGAIGLARFRRTLAWHIARRPGGLIALAIQYGHMRTVLDTRTSGGYASRNHRGIHSVLDVETALAAADTAAHLRDQAAAGERISGPAARRALAAAADTPRFEGQHVTRGFAKKAAKFLARDGVVLYDNSDAFLICAFKHDNALCEPDPGATAPRQYACQTGCGNAVRTDTHAQQLRQKADQIDQRAAHSPEPMAKKLRKNAAKLRELADNHDATARAAEDVA
ncbi:integrase [Nonomuraea sp. SYSU D8015]|uniref:integrase n=1 Tax=Nonomuraea sp. SYSU D8015 TaxID=2593644 RepID=UPI00166164B5|nr:integrase [Nonomuraea sp. SYSU D8015]